MNRKIRVGIVFGGRSAEHEVSLQSAKNVIDALDHDKYEPVLIGIDKSGRWYLSERSSYLLNENNPKMISLGNSVNPVTFLPGSQGNELMCITNQERIGPIDVVFPVLHGPYGEDGTIQGLLRLADIPFVGAGVLGSAVGMDKDVMKRLLRDAGIPVADFLVYRSLKAALADFGNVQEKLGLPVFVKPANLGSSVGISKVRNRAEYEAAVKAAFQFDRKILIEENVSGREIECSVLGNENPIASLPGEILPQADFYSYEAKYIDEKGAILQVPAELPENLVRRVQELAVEVFTVLCCEGMARVDLFLKEDGSLLVNELNSIPGFTRISMYPKLWEATGLKYPQLIDRLIELALQRAAEERMLKTTAH